MNERLDPSQALAWRWFQKAENDLLNVENNLRAEQAVAAAYNVRAWVRRQLDL